jgi:hypothetical protein
MRYSSFEGTSTALQAHTGVYGVGRGGMGVNGICKQISGKENSWDVSSTQLDGNRKTRDFIGHSTGSLAITGFSKLVDYQSQNQLILNTARSQANVEILKELREGRSTCDGTDR